MKLTFQNKKSEFFLAKKREKTRKTSKNFSEKTKRG